MGVDDLIRKPFFTVVIPLYNKGLHVARSVRSVLKQTSDFELIVVNVASTDNSFEQVLKIEGSRLSLLHRSEPSARGDAAKSLGIRKAKEQWVVFLDANDKWLPKLAVINHMDLSPGSKLR